MSNCDCQKNIEDPIKDASNFDCRKKPADGMMITTVTTTTAGIFFMLRGVGIEQERAILVSMAVAYLQSLPSII